MSRAWPLAMVVLLMAAEAGASGVVSVAAAGRGYEVVPVHPQLASVEGVPCARRVQDVTPPVAGALLMTPPAATETVVRDCAEAGVRRVWMHRGAGRGAVSEAAVAWCREHDGGRR